MTDRDFDRERRWRNTENDWDYDQYDEYRYSPYSPYRRTDFDRNFYGRNYFDRENFERGNFDRDYFGRDNGLVRSSSLVQHRQYTRRGDLQPGRGKSRCIDWLHFVWPGWSVRFADFHSSRLLVGSRAPFKPFHAVSG